MKRFPSQIAPMEAQSAPTLPLGKFWQYEPKWDGFRCIVFKSGDKVTLQSKALKPLTRYFPELVDAVKKVKAKYLALDAEIVIPEGKLLSFDALLQRIHPAKSRIQKLSVETPAVLIVFDLLCDENQHSLLSEPLSIRRPKLEKFAKKFLLRNNRFKLSPASNSVATTKEWLKKAGNGLDGLIAKRRDLPYAAGERDAMRKIKFARSADCVVGGFRYASKGKRVGSLLLGLYDNEGLLHHVGYVSAFGDLATSTFTKKLERTKKAPGFTGKAPGAPSRWSSERSAEWVPLAPSLVIEVTYDHLTGGRFRHGTKFLRWRPDKKAKQCLLQHVEQESGTPLAVLGH